jgi:predicted DNA-binding transcriptional regulator AlpA
MSQQSSNSGPRELIGKPELATLLGISTRTLDRLRSKGEVPRAVKIGGSVRWRLRDVRVFLDRLPTR